MHTLHAKHRNNITITYTKVLSRKEGKRREGKRDS
jgi:hypothetical protein